mgnify:CR=1 FL=1
MQIIKEKLDIDGVLEKRIKNTLRFLNIKSKIIKGNIIHIPKTNLAYIEPHKILINNITYLFFNECNDIYINTLENSIPFNEFKTNPINLKIKKILYKPINDRQYRPLLEREVLL